MRDTSGRFVRLKECSLGFTLIEVMIVIAVIGILAMVTVPKYQGLKDHYQLESSAQILAGQLRNAKQYAMDRRDNIYVMVNLTSVQVFYVDYTADKYSPLVDQQTFDSGVTLVQGDSQGLKNIPSSVTEINKGGQIHQISNSNIPPNFDKCLIFDRKGFLSGPVELVLTSVRTGQRVSVIQTLDSLEIKITWL